jgi:hypothetical protein
MKVVNIKGEDFDPTGVEVLDLSEYVLSRFGGISWDHQVFRMKFPKGKFIIPLEHPPHWSFCDNIIRSQKDDLGRVVENVGFQVDGESEKNDVVTSFGYQLATWEKKQARKKEKALAEEHLKVGTFWTPAARMMIPDIGTIFRLEVDWVFSLHHEYRNSRMLEVLGRTFAYSWGGENTPTPGPFDVTIKAGAILTVDRIYIRKGAEDFSSLTFILRSSPDLLVLCDGKEFKVTKSTKKFGVARFWAKLSDVNRMVVSALEETVKQ